jgi:hypothetical protein
MNPAKTFPIAAAKTEAYFIRRVNGSSARAQFARCVFLRESAIQSWSSD